MRFLSTKVISENLRGCGPPRRAQKGAPPTLRTGISKPKKSSRSDGYVGAILAFVICVV
jgi:hypothetical protein